MHAKIGRWILFSLGLIAIVMLINAVRKDSKPQGEVAEVADYVPWEEATVEMASLLPVQDGGRAKPLGTYAGFTMLALRGERSMEVKGKDGKKVVIKPIEWMLDCLFRPELAKQLPTFRVDNSEVLTAVGVKAKDRRDRYTFNEIAAQVPKLKEAAEAYGNIPAERRKLNEKQTIELYSTVGTFEALTKYMDFARQGLLPPSDGPDGHRFVPISNAMEKAPDVRAAIAEYQRSGAVPPDHIQLIQRLIIEHANRSNFGLKFFPSSDPKNSEWVSAGDRMFKVFTPAFKEPEQSILDVRLLEDAVQALKTGGEAAFRDKFAALEDSIVKRAKERGEYRAIPLEADYFRKDWLYWSLIIFIVATVVSAVMLFTGENLAGKISFWLTVSLMIGGLVMLIIPITKRSIIMMRPPVGNLYDTIIFIDMALVIFALMVLWMTKKRFVLGVAPIVAAFLVFLARRFEVGEAKDHLDPLIAVLRSNFWLSTHVIIVTLGYASGLIAALISVVYVMLRVLGLDNGDLSLRRSVTRAAYGCLCLTLLLSLIGTVLGGIWANDSWGRFWGWDPKENGALMIVLWTLAVLHARLGGYIREWGMHLASMFGAIVVAFSWWHVNFFNVGLHNYGFADDKKNALYGFYGLMAVFILAGAIFCIIERVMKASNAAARANPLVPDSSEGGPVSLTKG